MKIQKFQKGKVILNTFDALGDLMKKGTLEVKPQTTPKVVKPTSERVIYTPPVRRTAEEKQIYNAWQKYKTREPYKSMFPEQAYKAFVDDWNFRHDSSRQLRKNVLSQINHQDRVSGLQTPEWLRNVILKVSNQYPSSVRTDIPETFVGNITPQMLPYKKHRVYDIPAMNPAWMKVDDGVFRTMIAPKQSAIYKSNPDILKISDYFSGRSYRGIGDLDRPFINATDAFNAGASDAAIQFLRAGLNDAAGIIGMPGFKPVSFPYKPRLKTK